MNKLYIYDDDSSAEEQKCNYVGRLRVAVTDFLPTSRGEDRFFRNWAIEKGFILDNSNPDILIHGCSGMEHLHIPAKIRVSSTGENVFPNLNLDDYSISHMRESVRGRNLWWPQFLYYLKEP